VLVVIEELKARRWNRKTNDGRIFNIGASDERAIK
jgi:hypothetical protein